MPLPLQKRKHLDSQARELVSKVYDFMKKEANEKYVEKITDARWRTSQATGVSESTITRILKEKITQSATSSGFTSPLKKKKVEPRKINIENFDVGVFRRTIQDFHKEFNQTPTLNNLRNVLKERILFDGSKSSLNRMLYNLGYRWRKTDTRRKLLTEKQDVQWSRFNYLKQIKAFRDSGRSIVYTDESYIYTNNKQNKSLVKKDSSIQEKPKSMKGPRYIMVHAGSSTGFIPNALLLYNTDTKTGFNDIMDSNGYLKWLESNLIPNLPKDAVVVMDDAAYHNTISEKIPTLNTSKKEMQAWLTAKNIPYEKDFLRIELYDLIKKNKDKHRTYEVDEMLNAHNFSVLRLPTHHPELSPMENIWDLVRNYVVSHNDELNNTLYLDTLNNGFEDINSKWASACRHVEQIEDEYMKHFELDDTVIITDPSDSESDNDYGISELSNDSDFDNEMLLKNYLF